MAPLNGRGASCPTLSVPVGRAGAWPSSVRRFMSQNRRLELHPGAARYMSAGKSARTTAAAFSFQMLLGGSPNRAQLQQSSGSDCEGGLPIEDPFQRCLSVLLPKWVPHLQKVGISGQQLPREAARGFSCKGDSCKHPQLRRAAASWSNLAPAPVRSWPWVRLSKGIAPCRRARFQARLGAGWTRMGRSRGPRKAQPAVLPSLSGACRDPRAWILPRVAGAGRKQRKAARNCGRAPARVCGRGEPSLLAGSASAWGR